MDMILLIVHRLFLKGTHDSLVAKDEGIYKKLVLRQLMVEKHSSNSD